MLKAMEVRIEQENERAAAAKRAKK